MAGTVTFLGSCSQENHSRTKLYGRPKVVEMDSQEKHFALSSPVFNAESSGAAPSLACGSDVLHRRGRHNRSVDDDFGSSDASSIQQTSNGSPFNTKNKLQRLASKTKKATKRLVNAPEQHDKLLDLHQIEDQSRRVLRADAAFNVKQLDTEHRSEKGIAAKVQVNLRAIAKGIAHPKEGIKAKAARSTAGHLAGMERPYLSKNMDIDLLEAHEGLSQAQSAASSARTTSEEEETPEIGSGREKVMQMEVQRESLRAAYTTSRFVQRVRVVPKRHIDFPEAEHFMRRDAQGEHINYDWLLWIGFVRVLTWSVHIMVTDSPRICCTILRTFLRNMLTTLMSCHSV